MASLPSGNCYHRINFIVISLAASSSTGPLPSQCFGNTTKATVTAITTVITTMSTTTIATITTTTAIAAITATAAAANNAGLYLPRVAAGAGRRQ